MSGKGPIFIVGAMGSGTTLLRLVLDSHEHIAIPRETGFMRAYNAHRYAPFKWSGRDWIGRLGWPAEESTAVMGEFYDRLFMRYAEQHGKERWGEKTPLHTWHVDGIVDLFPDVQLVGMVRHPLGSAASNISRFGTPVPKAARHWQRYTREITRQCARHRDRMVIVRYEDLVLRPEPTLRELLDWLGEPWSPTVLEHHLVHTERGATKKVEGRTLPGDQIDISRIDKWTRTLPRKRQRWLGRRMKDLGAVYGYSVEDAAVLDPVGPADRILVGGADIAAQVEAHRELDLLAEPWVTPYERLYDPRKLMVLEKDEYRRLRKPPPPTGARKLAADGLRRIPPGPRRRLLSVARGARSRLRRS